MTFSLPQKTHILWFLRMFFVIAPLCAIIVNFCKINSIYLLPTAILTVIAAAFLFLYVFMYLKSYKITFDEAAVTIVKGVIIKTTVIIPFRALAFVKTFSAPITSWLGLKFVILKVTRGWVFLPEIENKYAETLLKIISDDKNDD